MSEEPKPVSGLDADAIERAESQATPFDIEASGDDEGRRRRPVADWGGDDLFDYVPRRRFSRPGAPPRRAGAVPAPARSTRRQSDSGETASSRPPAHRGDVELNAAHIRSPYTPPKPALTIYEPAADAAVVEDVLPAASRRERPALPVSQRLGPRPDRIAAWAFMLGVVLILLAVGTADAAAL